VFYRDAVTHEIPSDVLVLHQLSRNAREFLKEFFGNSCIDYNAYADAKKKEAMKQKIREMKAQASEAAAGIVEAVVPDLKRDRLKKDRKEEKKKAEIKIFSDPLQKQKQKLLETVRKEFSLLRQMGDHRISDRVLERMTIQPLRSKALADFDKDRKILKINASHRAFSRILDKACDDSSVLACLVSCIYSAINRALKEIEDPHELRFEKTLAALLASRLREKASPESAP
jgi:HSP90 family molecular chaperone